MRYVNLGASGLQVSRPCLGAMMFGHSDNAPTSEADSRRIIDAFLDAGGNFIDTANVYVRGESEEVVGRPGHVGDPHPFVGGHIKVDIVDSDPELLDEAEGPRPDGRPRQRRPQGDDHVDGRPAVDQARFELALPDDLDQDSAGKAGRPVLRHLGPGVILGEALLAYEHP